MTCIYNNRNINILQLTTVSEIGGAEKLVLEIISSLKDENTKFVVASLYGEGPLRQHVEKLGIPFIDLKLDNIFKFPFRLKKVLKDYRIDMVQVHGFTAEVVVCPLAKFFGIKSVVRTIHGIEGFKKWYKNILARITSLAVDLWISVSIAGKKMLERNQHVSKKKIEVIHNGIALKRTENFIDKYKFREKIRVGQDDFLVLTIANLRSIKGHETILQAIANLKNRGINNIKFVFVGKDFSRGGINLKSKELGIENYIRLLGFQDNVGIFIQYSDVFLLPSKSEGLPLSVMEAMQGGLPVVASRVGGIPELIEDGKHGILIPPGSFEAVADALVRLMNNPEYRTLLGRNSRKRIEEHFSIDKMSGRYRAVFDACMRKIQKCE